MPPTHKLTLISLSHNGITKSIFMTLEYTNGRAVMTHEAMDKIVKLVFPGVHRGECIAWW